MQLNEDERLGSLVGIYKRHFGSVAEIVFDCGTRDGDDAAYLGERLQAKKVYAIDASPKAVEQTRESHPHLEVIHTALSNFNGESQFTQIISDRKDFEGSSSLITNAVFPGALYSTYSVKVTRMDALLKELGLEQQTIGLMKVDLEGFTYEFLEGLGELIANVCVFHLETERFYRHVNHKNSEEVAQFMRNSNFDLMETSYEWGPSIEDQVWVNKGKLEPCH